jgi:hypothetical protein
MQNIPPALKRKEVTSESHDYIVKLVQNFFIPALVHFRKEQLFRYVTSRHLAAQEFAELYIKYELKTNLKVHQYVFCANADLLQLREYAWCFFNEFPEYIKAHKKEALKILDAKWEDSRVFGFEYFKEKWTIADWTASLLVSIVDSVREDVQLFGRYVISAFFKENYGNEFLLKLSQHPSADIQLLASNYLEGYAAGNRKHFEELIPYFTTVLLKVNKGSVVKQRVLQFIEKEALAAIEIAKIATPVLQKVIASLSYNTSGNAVAIMLKIQKTYPELQQVLETIDYETR